MKMLFQKMTTNAGCIHSKAGWDGLRRLVAGLSLWVAATLAIHAQSPLPTGGLVLWLKADAGVLDSSGNPVSNGGSVATWQDQSGSLYLHHALAVSGSSPSLVNNFLNGKPAISFNGTSQFLDIADEAGLHVHSYTIIAVIASNAPTSTGSYQDVVSKVYSPTVGWHPPYASYLFSIQSSTDGGFPYFGGVDSSNTTFHQAFGATSVLGTSAAPLPQIVTGTYGSSIIQCYLKGTLQPSPTSVTSSYLAYASSVADLVIGATCVNSATSPGQFYNGKISEIIIYNSVLSSADRIQVESYLADKYGLYHPNATWPLQYSTAMQVAIAANKWDKSAADTAAAFQNAHPQVPTPGLSLWLKADAGITLTGAQVSQWTDQAGGWNFTNSTTSNSTLPTFIANESGVNNKPGVRFSVGQPLISGGNLGTNGAMTFISMAMATNTNSNEYLFIGGVADWAVRFFGCWQGKELFGTGSQYRLGLSASSNTYRAEVTTLDAARQNVGFYVNGSPNGTATVSGLKNMDAGMKLGSGYQTSWDGDISEVMIYNRLLTSSELTEVYVYLANKYGISISTAPLAIYPLAGTYRQQVQVSMLPAVPSSVIRYTTDGTTPTLSSPLYNPATPLVLSVTGSSVTTTVKAIAVTTGGSPSAVYSNTYTVQPYPTGTAVATPAFSPMGGAYGGSVSVTLASATSGATIYYTIDGTIPTHSSSVYSAVNPLSISATTTVKALASASGLVDSPVVSQAYTIDGSGPALTSPKFNGNALINSNTLILGGTFSVSATDPQGVARVDFLMDGVVLGSSTGPTYSANFPISAFNDASHSLTIKAYDTLGNMSSLNFDNLIVQEAAPVAPYITSPTGTTSAPFVSSVSPILVKGTAAPGSTITFYNNSVAVGSTVLAASDTIGAFQGSINLGASNSIQVTATNPDGRGGESAKSAAVVVTLSQDIPPAPTAFHATTLAAGAIQLSWGAFPLGSVSGYNIYRSSSPFTDPAQGTKINSDPITASQYTDIPDSGEGTYYYLVVAVSTATPGIVGVASQQQTGVSDKTAPTAAVTYTPHGENDSTEMAPGIVDVSVTMSEPLRSTPFLNVTPSGGYPISISLQPDSTSNLHYTGSFQLLTTTPTGTATAVLSATDLAGNRGTQITSGKNPVFDTAGPTVSDLMISPATTIQNSSTAPVNVQVTLTLDKVVKSGTTPSVGYALSSNPAVTIPFSSVVAGTNDHTWVASTQLAGSVASTATENMVLTFSALDHLNNPGTTISVPHQFQVYQGDVPPGLEAPFGLTAVPMPGGKIQLTWQAVNGASDYQVYRKGPSDSSLLPLVLSGGAVTYLDTAGDGTYTYTVASVRNLNGHTSTGVQSGSVSALAQSTPTSAPQTLSATMAGYGVALAWQAPAGLSETVTYSVYRSANPITDLSSLTPFQTKITAIAATDPNPDPTQLNYAVAAVDAAGNVSLPSNSVAVTPQVLPVTALTITQTDSNPPVISWAAVPGSTTGYNVYLGADDALQQINAALVTSTSFTDAGYTSNERRYTIKTVAGANTSVGHSLTLPLLTATLASGAVVRKGLINDLVYTVTNSSAETISNIDVRVAINGQNDVSPSFSLTPGQSQQVTVVVGGDGVSTLPQGSVPIQTSIEVIPHAGELVSIQRSGSVPVVEGALVASVLPSGFTRGGTGCVRFSLTNPSPETIQVIVARNQGLVPSDQVRINVMDGNNVIYSTTPVSFSTGGNVVTLSDGTTVLQIPPGQTVTSPVQHVSVPAEIPDNAYVQLVIDHVYYHEGQPDVVTLLGLTSRQAINVVAASYSASVTTVTPATSYGTQTITISGTATFAVGGAAANQPVVLHVDNDGFDLTYQVATDASGNFTYSFAPPPGTLGGVYTTWAVNPQVTDRTVQQTFNIKQVAISPAAINLSAPKNYPQTVNFTAHAGPGTSATNLHFVYLAADQAGGVFPAGLSVDVTHSVASLAENASATLPVIITADSTVATGSIILRLRSDNDSGNIWQTVKIDYTFADAVPSLLWQTSLITAGVHPGDAASTNLTLTNQGLAAANNVTFKILNQADGTLAPSWVTLGSAVSLNQLNAGVSAPVVVNFNPPSTQAQGTYHFIVRASAPNQSNQDAHICLTVSTSETGIAHFLATDIYTGTTTTDAGGHSITNTGVVGATISLQNVDVDSIKFSGATTDAGELSFDVPVGHYQYQASAPGHDSVSGSIWIQPGITTNQTVSLQNNLVSVSWQVTPTSIQDRYDLTISATFETNVPAAVVTVEPGAINLPPLQTGDVYNGQLTFTNHGTIAAQNVQFSLPPDDGNLHYELQGAMPETLAAGQTVTLPYRVTCIQGFPTAVQMTMVGGASGTLVASFGLLAFGWGRRRSFYRLGAAGVICSLTVLTLVFPKKAFAQTTTSDCYHYMTGCALVGSYKCTNGVWYHITTKVIFTYIINNCPSQATAPSTAYVNSPAGGGAGGGGGTTYSPASLIGGSKDCIPRIQGNCDSKLETNSFIDLTQREFRDSGTDLSVKIPGGAATIARDYYYNVWHWRDLTEGLTFNAGAGGVNSIDYITATYTVVDAEFTTYEQSVTHNRIFAISGGYRWQSTTGAWKIFDALGKLQATGIRNLTLTQLQYDGSNNLTGVKDASGNDIFTVTSSGGHITSIQDATGRHVDYAYNGDNLTTITDALDQHATYAYNSNGQVTSKTDVNNHTFTITYDNGGYVTSEVDSKGNGWFFSFSYDAGLQQYYAQIKTSGGKVEEKTFASDGTLILDLLNGVQQKKILRGGNSWNITEANGATIQQTYDEFGNLLKEVRPEGTTTYVYNPTYNQPTQITYPDGTIATMSYDTNGNLTSKTEAFGTSLARTTSYSYDAYNQLTEKIDPRGNKTDYTYDANGNLLREYDPLTPTVQVNYTYDAIGNRLTRTDSLGNTTHDDYDALGRVTTETNALGQQNVITYAGKLVSQVETGKTSSTAGRVTQFTYDQQGRRLKVIRGSGTGTVQQTTTYDNDGNVVAETNALGQSTTYQYDQSDRRISTTQPFGSTGSVRTTTYNADGTVLSETDPNSTVTSYTYDTSGRVLTRTEGVGTDQHRSTTYQYDAMSRVTKVTYSDSTHTFCTNYGYDALGRRTSITGQREYPKTDLYDANDNLVSETDARNYTTTYQYDKYNRRTAVNAPGQNTTFTYDLNGNLLTVTDGNGVSRGYAYDALNRQVAQSIPMSSLPTGWASIPADVLSSVTYDAFGQVTATSDVTGGTTATTYDDLGRVSTRTSSSGLVLTYAYTPLDQVSSITYPGGSKIQYVYNSVNAQLLDSVTDRAGNTTSYQYDVRFLKTQETSANGAVTHYAYDPLGRMFMQTDALGHATLWSYDQFDQVTTTMYPDTSTPATYTYDAFGKLLTQGGTGQYPVTYGYDLAGNRISLTDGNNSHTLWAYDGLNRVTTKTYADTKTYQYAYDPAGNLSSRTDAMSRVTQYHYNAYNLVSQVAYPTNPAVNFLYDALGRRTQMTDGSGTTTWTWDSASRNTGYTQSAIGKGIAYAYDAENHRSTMGVGPISGMATWTTQYGYDSAGRLKTILDNRVSATSPFTYAYQPGTNWVSGRSNADGSGVLNQYDVLGRLTRVSAANALGGAINTYAYTYDAAGQRTQEASTVGTRNFGYDNLRQLTSAYRVDGSGNPLPSYNFAYTFDTIGNWTKEISGTVTTNFTPNNLNQYSGISVAGSGTTASPTYDFNGNMTADGKGDTYIYDEENRLTEVDTATNRTISVYDGLSRRIEKRTYNAAGTTLLTTTRYLYDGQLPIAEYDAGNNQQITYARGLDLSRSLQGAGGLGGLLTFTGGSGSNSYSYFADGNGNIVDLTDVYGVSAAHYEYSPFGDVVAQAGALQQNYQWSSKEIDASAGLIYYGFRFYNLNLKRWQNRDPAQEVGGFNLYEYVSNAPSKNFDDYGLCTTQSLEFEFPIMEESLLPLPAPPFFLDYSVSLGVRGEVEACCCNENPLLYKIKGTPAIFSKGEIGYTAGFTFNKEFFGGKIAIASLAGIRASAGLEGSGSTSLNINACAKEVEFEGALKLEGSLNLEGGLRGLLLVRNFMGLYDDYGIGASIRGTGKVEGEAEVKCNSETCKANLHVHGNATADFNLALWNLNYTYNLWESRDIFDYSSRTYTFKSPFKL